MSWDVVQVNKRPTRLPEAGFFSFTPAIAATHPSGWRLHVLGSSMDPMDVLGSGPGGEAHNSSVYGGSPHLRGVEAITWAASASSGAHAGASASTGAGADSGASVAEQSFRLTSLDVPIVAAGAATPFVTPRTEPPDMHGGVHFNIFQNLWNTNYVLWYPFQDSDRHVRSRFQLELLSSGSGAGGAAE